jgi:hypothetical protein
MKWIEIHKQSPNRFILLGNIVEKKIPEFKSQIIEGTIIGVFDDGKDTRKAYIPK